MFATSCSEPEEEVILLAKVGESVFTLDDLRASMPVGLSSDDSIEQAASIVQAWMNQRLMYDKARFNLDEAQLNIDRQVEKYRQELFIFEYEKEIIRQKLDTLVTQEEVSTFYNENQGIFQLNDYILKVRYAKLLPNTPDLDKVSEWLQSNDSISLQKLQDYCYSYAASCFMDTNWVYFNDLIRELPLEVYNKSSFLRKGKFIKFSDTEHLYFLYVITTQSKNTLSPLELEADRIRSLILNKRKVELLGKIRRSIYRDAVRSGKAIIYDEPKKTK